MGKKTAHPAQAGSTHAASARTAPAVSGTSRNGSPLITFLTVLLILVGVIDMILWGVVVYYLLQRTDGEELPQAIAANEENSGEERELDALEIYIQDMQEIWSRHDEINDRYNRVRNADHATLYTELTEYMIPSFRQVFEDAAKVTSDDPEIMELQTMFQEYGAKRLDACTMKASAAGNQDGAQREEADEQTDAANALLDAYKRALLRMAEERNIPNVSGVQL